MYGIYEGAELIARFIVPARVRNNQLRFSSETLSMKTRTSRKTPQKWEIEAQIEPLTVGAEVIWAMMLEKDVTEPFSISIPQIHGAVLRLTASSTITASGAQGDGTVTLASNDGFLPTGTFIKFANHNKIYATTSNRDGNGTIGIFPRLLSTVPGGTAMKYRDDVIGPFLLNIDNINGMVFDDGILANAGTLLFQEDL
jgi:hypothetical protein